VTCSTHFALVSEKGVLDQLSLGSLRKLRSGLRQRGYLIKALDVAKVCAERGQFRRQAGRAADRR
jgi:hypothetical protein